jgi:GT2 family glycosyltransferase/tetratricopeptide (TPR) repeat protein
MSKKRVAVIFDNTVRRDTTGIYCRRALGQFTEVEHFLPTELARLGRSRFDLYLAIDDGLNYPIPGDLHPSAYWAIDTHLDFERELGRARVVDFVFAAQRDGAQRLRQEGVTTATWLPLACDPEIHGRQEVPERYDICFVGNLFPGPRDELLRLIQERFPNSFVGRRFFTEMARTYSESRIVFNRSLANDINMRVFEALASGSLVMTNELRENGQDELFRDGIHLATYRDAAELLDKILFYLGNPELRQRVAETGRQAVLAEHAYLNRMQAIVAALDERLAKPAAGSPGGMRPEVAAVADSARIRTNGESPNSGDFGHQARSQASSNYPTGVALCPSDNGRGITSIVLVTCGQLEYTRLCLESIRKHTPEPHELIVVDNGSIDGTVEYLRLRDDVKLIANFENRGFPAAANHGMLAAKGQQILLLNNDTLATTEWLSRMLHALQSDSSIGLVGPCSNNVSGQQQISFTYDHLDAVDPFAKEWGKTHQGQAIETDRLVGFCLLIRRELIDRIGLLDERFGIGNFEDDDFCRRAIQAGYRAVIAVGAFVHHFGSRTFMASDIDFGALMAENRRKFDEKWSSAGRAPAVNGERRPSAITLGESGAQSESSSLTHTGGLTPRSPISTHSRSWNSRVRLTSSANGELLLQPGTPTVCLCMIVRDNETTIRPCMESIRPWVGDMVVVDTGSKDRTPEICREYGARVFEFPWCDDFSAARNESLKHAHGEWIFWMDSDDTIPEECGRKLQQLVLGPHDPNCLGYVIQVHCPGPGRDGEPDVTIVDHVKLFRNRPDLGFEGQIHEQVLPSIRRANGNVAWTDIYVVHSGADHSPESFQRKLERDFRILNRELADNPRHPFVLFNLGMTYADAKRYGEAIQYLQRCLDASQPDESHLRKAYALLVSSLSQAERHDEAWHFCQQGLRLYPDDKELHFRCAMLHHHFGRLNDAEQSYLKVLNSQEQRHFSSVDQGLGGYKARHNLAIVYDDMGRLGKAEQQWRLIVNEVPDYLPGWRGLGESLLKQGRQVGFRELVGELLAHPKRRATGRLLESRFCEEQNDLAGARLALEMALREVPDASEPLQELCRLLFATAPAEDAADALERLVDREPQDAAACHNLGTVYCRLARYDDAVTAYRKSLELRPRSEPTRKQLEFAAAQGQALKRSPQRARI